MHILRPTATVCSPQANRNRCIQFSICSRSRLYDASICQQKLSSQQRPGTTFTARAANLNTSSIDEAEIEGLSRDYCDDFVCTTSPQVEQNVRALARDLQRPKSWTKSLFCGDCAYEGFLRSFRGWHRYERHKFISQHVAKPQVTIQRLRMEDRGTAVIDWRLQGRILNLLSVDASVASTFWMNLLTGRVERHRDAWDLSGSSLPAQAALVALRAGWAARQKAKDIAEDSSRLLDRLQPDDGIDVQGDPTDPTRFFQDNARQQNFDDAVKFATLLAIIWLLFKLGNLVL